MIFNGYGTKSGLSRVTRTRYGELRRMEKSQSLYEVGNGACRVYIRYSKIHGTKSTFYGLRHEDLQLLEGSPSVICFTSKNRRNPC